VGVLLRVQRYRQILLDTWRTRWLSRRGGNGKTGRLTPGAWVPGGAVPGGPGTGLLNRFPDSMTPT